ncbi:type II secretion system F family protein [Micavibrio aeruginosavorus]|uniref:Type II/IV secretion system protein TadC, associated with Flp pilus assembly n=1 Tax=Micavibrio aeruginosavorus EPB TaxID=349215 RepID=M4VDP3_9BACT|nr:type II secretion system F family protein [Micavibrio aeruginosavorus]AGH97348.1 Type II/IV secretion system protein TadC, associated with Flp pilus assembly [Micavibrio aeruginosavorus EPB]
MQAFFEGDGLVVFLAAIAAAISFVAFLLPLMQRSEKKERYRSVIEKKRKTLFEATREQSKKGYRVDEKSMSARDSMTTLFKVEQLMGDMGEKVRDMMLQAGNRDPSAPIKFIVSRFAIAIFLVVFAIIIITSSDKEISNGVSALIIIAAAGLGYQIPKILVKNQIVKRSQEINLTFADALDMMLICVQGGVGLEQTINRIADEISEHSPTLAEELGILSAEMAMLNDRRGALQDFARRVGSGAARSFATALIQAEQYGTSVSQAMRVMADELRDQRMAEAERKAASLPPKLTVPMILFFLPVLFVIIIAPAVMRAFSKM